MAGPSPKARAELHAKIRAYLALGYTIVEIASEVGQEFALVEAEVGALRQAEEATCVGQRTEAVFVDYVIQSHANLRQLDDAIAQFREGGQGMALVGAIKAKQEIADRIIKRGQEFGVIARKPQQHEILLARLDDRALREVLAREVAALRDTVALAGVKGLLEVEDPIEALPDAEIPKKGATVPRAAPAQEPARAPLASPAPAVIRKKALRSG